MVDGWLRNFMPKITQKTTLAELLDNSKAIEILKKYNLPCLGCPFAKEEIENLKIDQVCKMYNINFQDLLKDLNRVYNK